MVALQARNWATLGIATLLVDPYGTADSEGDFADARWEIWCDDLRRAAQWLFGQGAQRLSFWGLRLGALLAVEVVVALEQIEHLILWQPVLRGEVFMTQFLRLYLAADLAGGAGRLTTRDLRASLNAGNVLEIAGYRLAPQMLTTIDGLSLQSADVTNIPRIDWIEIVANAEQPIAVASQHVLDRWRESGVQAMSHTVAGDPFWCTPEITVSPALLDITTGLFAEDHP